MTGELLAIHIRQPRVQHHEGTKFALEGELRGGAPECNAQDPGEGLGGVSVVIHD
jgi:hypothetical protein